MKSNRLFATAALLGAISFAMPIYAHAQDNSMEGGAKEMYHGAKTDVKDTGITTKIKGCARYQSHHQELDHPCRHE